MYFIVYTRIVIKRLRCKSKVEIHTCSSRLSGSKNLEPEPLKGTAEGAGAFAVAFVALWVSVGDGFLAF